MPLPLGFATWLSCVAMQDPSCLLGYWEPPFDHDVAGFQNPPHYGFITVHLALIPKGPNRGRVIAWDHEGNQGTAQWLQRWSVVDVAANPPSFQNDDLLMPAGVGDLFCAGHSWTPNGDLFVTGGTARYEDAGLSFLGGVASFLYDPESGAMGAWTRLDDLEKPRWYPTTTLIGNDQVLVFGGIPDTFGPSLNDYEVFDTTTNSWRSYGGSRTLDGPEWPAGGLSLYARMHLLSTGEVFASGMSAYSAKLDHEAAPGVWTPTSGGAYWYYDYGSSVLAPNSSPRYRDGVLRLGGEAYDLFFNSFGPTSTVEFARAGVSGAPRWNWRPAPALNQARMHCNAVLLPDGSVLALGGRTNSWSEPVGTYTTTPEILHPAFGEWVELPDEASPRDYHAVAALLPDGRVLSSGGEARSWDYQIYVPGYLACGNPRPVLRPIPTEDVFYGVTYTLPHDAMPAGAMVQKVVLMRPASVTHHSDFDQRYVELEVLGQTATSITVQAPPTSAHAPRGYYMLFLVSNQGVPSEAGWVRLE